MHHKEYLSAGNDAKLLLAILPPAQTELFVFGHVGDWERLEAELAVDPRHTLILWPGDGALTVEGFVSRLPVDSAWRTNSSSGGSAAHEASSSLQGASSSATTTVPGTDSKAMATTDREPVAATCKGSAAATWSGSAPPGQVPLLRVVVLDGVYRHARNMYKALRTRLTPAHVPPHVALHPKTLSVYHRATKNFGAASALDVARSADPEALHICTVEACALLLRELGEGDDTTSALIRAVVVNNAALKHDRSVRPPGAQAVSRSSGAARRQRTRNRAAASKAAEQAEAEGATTVVDCTELRAAAGR